MFNDVYDEQAATGFRGSLERRWARVGQADIPIDLPVFDEFLQDYAIAYRWRIATGDDFKRLAEQHCHCDITPLFDAWVYPK